MAFTFEQGKVGYQNLWDKAELLPAKAAEARAVAKRIVQNRARYEAVSKKTGVPWVWIAAAHQRESGGDFRGVLHNGERILGTGKKTRLVPADRGPFTTWEEAAEDALEIKGLHKITDWSIPRMLFEWERFNGFGYAKRGVNSPYVWAGTTLQQRGKYVADGKYSATTWDTQLGTAAVLKALDEIAEEPLQKPQEKADEPKATEVAPEAKKAPTGSVEAPKATQDGWVVRLIKGLFG